MPSGIIAVEEVRCEALPCPEVPAATTAVEEMTAVADQLVGYNAEGATLYDVVASESLPHRYVMGYSLKKAIGDVKGQKVLEAACGNGTYMEYVLEKGASFVCGVDLCSENLDVCRKNHQAKGIPTTSTAYVQADLIMPKEYEAGPFDTVIMGCCICYSPNREALDGWLQNAYVNLKPGGRLVCINTRGALPADGAQQEYLEKFKVDYLKEKEGGSKSYDPAYVTFPNGWTSGDYWFLEASTIKEAMIKIGFEVENPPMSGDPQYAGDEDLARAVELAPYDLFIATK